MITDKPLTLKESKMKRRLDIDLSYFPYNVGEARNLN